MGVYRTRAFLVLACYIGLLYTWAGADADPQKPRGARRAARAAAAKPPAEQAPADTSTSRTRAPGGGMNLRGSFRALFRAATVDRSAWALLLLTIASAAAAYGCVLTFRLLHRWYSNGGGRAGGAGFKSPAAGGAAGMSTPPRRMGGLAAVEGPGALDEKAVCPYGLARMQGRRPYMEDRALVASQLGGDARRSLYGVFDGHGGANAAEFAARHLAENVTSSVHFPARPAKAFAAAFKRTDADYLALSTAFVHKDDGTTAVAALVDDASGTVVVANAGDSRCVLCKRDGRAVALSDDHKPNRADERARVEALGGTVVFWGVWRVEGVLAVSRALGDRALKRYVTAEPEVQTCARARDDAFLVLASDGLWDVVRNDEVAAMVTTQLASYRGERGAAGTVSDAQLGAERLAYEAYARGSTDNICVLVVDLRR